jgi:hypothetical protein
LPGVERHAIVGIWVSDDPRRSIRQGSFPNVRTLIRHIEAYIQNWSQDPTPFVWTKNADELVTKAVRR